MSEPNGSLLYGKDSVTTIRRKKKVGDGKRQLEDVAMATQQLLTAGPACPVVSNANPTPQEHMRFLLVFFFQFY